MGPCRQIPIYGMLILDLSLNACGRNSSPLGLVHFLTPALYKASVLSGNTIMGVGSFRRFSMLESKKAPLLANLYTFLGTLCVRPEAGFQL